MDGRIAAGIAVVGAILTGRSICGLIERFLVVALRCRPFAEVWGLSTMLGLGFTAAAGFVWSDMGRALNDRYSWNQVIGGVFFGLVAIVNAWRRTRGMAPVPPRASDRTWLVRSPQIIVGLLIGWALLSSWNSTTRIAAETQRIEVKARLIYESGTIDDRRLLESPSRLPDPRQPLLLPLLERHTYALAGGPTDHGVRVWYGVIYAGLLLSVAGVFTRRYSLGEGWWVTVGVGLLPALLTGESGFLAAPLEAALAGFHGVAVLYLWDAVQLPPGPERRRGLFLAASMSSCGVFVHHDGLALLAAVWLSWGVTALFCRGQFGADLVTEPTLRRLTRHGVGMLAFAAAAALLLTPWMRYRAGLPLPIIPDEVSSASWRESISDLLYQMLLTWQLSGLTWWMLLATIYSAGRRCLQGPELFLLLNLVSGVMGLAVSSPLAIPEWSLPGMGSDTRAAICLSPVAILATAALLAYRTPTGKANATEPKAN